VTVPVHPEDGDAWAKRLEIRSGTYILHVRWTELPKVRALQARSRRADVAVRTAEGFRKHRSGRNAALIAHYGFLSVFPLFLVFTTVLGFVLQSHPKLRQDILDSAMNQLPFIGQQLSADPSKLHGSVVVLVLGLGAAMWAGMKAFVAVHGALDDISEVPLDERSNLLTTRLRALLGMAYIGGAQVGAAILTGLASVTGVAVISKVLLLIFTTAINAGVLALSYRWLRTAWPSWRSVMPGAIVGGVLFAALQIVGVAIVGRSIAKASPVYGTFASVIGLLTWLSLHAIIALGGAELNQALTTNRPPNPPDCEAA
jgi:membrane protein